MDAAPVAARAGVPSDASHLPRPEYPLAQAPEDIQRLIARVSRRNTGTREVPRQAGLALGMRVLDAGSGAGDVAMMTAELVGPTLLPGSESTLTSSPILYGIPTHPLMFAE